MPKIDIIIFTKNRASQLQLLLRSIVDKFKFFGDIYILYTYSNGEYGDAYQVLKDEMYGKLPLIWVMENNFKRNTIDIIENKMQTDCFLGLCDDDVFVNSPMLPDYLDEILLEQYSAFSLKAGLNITHNYPSFKLDFPKFIHNEDNILSWNWTENPSGIDWGYPTCTNSFIFNRSYYLKLIDGLEFNQTANLEGGLNGRRNQFRQIMVCNSQSSLLNIPCNRLQTVSENPFGQVYPFSACELNNKWLGGYQIRIDNIYNHKIYMPNIELPFVFEKRVK